jgi:hypothetical protein
MRAAYPGILGRRADDCNRWPVLSRNGGCRPARALSLASDDDCSRNGTQNDVPEEALDVTAFDEVEVRFVCPLGSGWG